MWTLGHSQLLNIGLSTILRAARRVQVYRTSVSHVVTGEKLPKLTHLECDEVCLAGELAWVAWHLHSCPDLARIRLGTRPAVNRTYRLLEGAPRLRSLRDLSLEGFDVSLWEPTEMHSLRRLELRHCRGTVRFLHRLSFLGNVAPRVVRVVAEVEPRLEAQFLGSLTRFAGLEELALCLSGISSSAAVRAAKAHAGSLTSMVLEVRSVVSDPRTVQPMSVDDLRDVVCSFPRLAIVGLSLVVGSRFDGQYKRFPMDFIARHDHLRVLHLRGRCRPRKRGMADARWIARPFLGVREITAVVDEGPSMTAFQMQGRVLVPAELSDWERGSLIL